MGTLSEFVQGEVVLSLCRWPIVALLLMMIAVGVEAKQLQISFVCSEKNDLYKVVRHSGYKCARFDSPAEAIQSSRPGSAVLVLADGYPDNRTTVDSDIYDAAAGRNLKLYIEYPSEIPGIATEDVRNTQWERAVVSSDEFGERLPEMHILSISGCHFVPAKVDNALISIARVAGFDSAVYGLPDSAYPILFRLPGREVLIATTNLSGFVTGRYAPSADWGALWERIIGLLDPASKVTLKWEPIVRPAYTACDKLPSDFEKQALVQGAGWYLNSRLLVSEKEKPEIEKLLAANSASLPSLAADQPVGDGSCGILEGYAAAIDYEGNQRRLIPLRADCNTEVAMALSMHSMVNGDQKASKIARNLLRYVYVDSGMAGGDRGNPKHPAFGLIAWGAISPAWMCANYGDDNARALLATILAQSCLDIRDWDEYIMRALLANLRTTGKLGFRPDRIDMGNLEQNGWRHFHDAEVINYSPHFESYLWACNIWAYKQTGYKPFIESAKNAIKMTMDAYPSDWRWNDTLERARMLLCLAWLVRLEDTAEHRAWLKTLTDDLISKQQPCGALPELLGGAGGGHYRIPESNEAYGTGETPLIQANGDPATDQLYTSGFALLGLREAAVATGDPALKAAEDNLAEYLCRIQVRSKQLPYVNGSWFRAFDFKRWDYWASSADAGWGAWSSETGWGPAWITAVLGLRLKDTCVWDMTSKSRVADHFSVVRRQLAENGGEPWKQ